MTVGVLLSRAYYTAHPVIRTVTVDRTITERVPIPGQTREVHVPVPVERTVTRTVEVPVEVTRYVDRTLTVPQERVVTVTRTIPQEVVREVERWPQEITVRVHSVQLEDGSWARPLRPDLRLVMLTPGVYAAPEQPGWNVEGVKTDTRVEPAEPPRRPQEPSPSRLRLVLAQADQTGAGLGYRVAQLGSVGLDALALWGLRDSAAHVGVGASYGDNPSVGLAHTWSLGSPRNTLWVYVGIRL